MFLQLIKLMVYIIFYFLFFIFDLIYLLGYDNIPLTDEQVKSFMIKK